jgi:hypothetical protein
MSLYLCVYAGDREVEGVEVGPYADFNGLRLAIVRELEGGVTGSRFPVLMAHSDCDGEWPLEACGRLRDELAAIAAAMKALPPRDWVSEWQRAAALQAGVRPRNAFESFVDVDGRFLLERLAELVEAALAEEAPILFQ